MFFTLINIDVLLFDASKSKLNINSLYPESSVIIKFFTIPNTRRKCQMNYASIILAINLFKLIEKEA